MPQFRKKPVVVQAEQFWPDKEPWPKGVLRDPGGDSPHCVIDTLEGKHVVTSGDWIITGINGERYPCKPDIFAATYSPEPGAVQALNPSWHPEAMDALLDYIALLELEDRRTAGFLMVHQMTTPPEVVEAGAKLRSRLSDLGIGRREARANADEGGRLEFRDISIGQWHSVWH